MKKFFTLLVSLLYCSLISAQIKDGFYRVQNDATKTYVYIYDNKGKAEIKGTNLIIDLDAIYLRSGLENTISDPGSVIYFQQKDKMYNFFSQGTSSYDIAHHYLSVTERNGLYALGAEEKGFKTYLTDKGSNSLAPGFGMISNSDSGSKLWKVIPISSDTENFFGVSPDIEVGGYNYTTFFADFAFKPTSTSTKVFYVKEFSDVAVLLQEQSGEIASQSPVIIQGVSKSSKDNKFDLLTEGKSIADNKLLGNYFNTDNSEEPFCFVSAKEHVNQVKVESNFRVLSKSINGDLEFSLPNLKTLPANSAYLKVSSTALESLAVFFNKTDYDSYNLNSLDIIQAKTNSDNIYNLLGKKVISKQNLPSGIYIINGKKTVIR